MSERMEFSPRLFQFVILAARAFRDEVHAIVVGLPAAKHVPHEVVADCVAEQTHLQSVSTDAPRQAAEIADDESDGEYAANCHGTLSFPGR